MLGRAFRTFPSWTSDPTVRSVKPKRSIHNRFAKPKVRSVFKPSSQKIDPEIDLSSQKFDHVSNFFPRGQVIELPSQHFDLSSQKDRSVIDRSSQKFDHDSNCQARKFNRRLNFSIESLFSSH